MSSVRPELIRRTITCWKNDEIFVSHDSYQILKYHGSYQQDNRELRKPKQQKAYSFMLRLKMPCGDVPAHLYRLLDDLCDKVSLDDPFSLR